VAAATARNAQHVASGRARFLQADFDSMDLGGQRFDKVFAMRVRLFFAEPERARELAQRWLAPGGQLFVEYDEPPGR